MTQHSLSNLKSLLGHETACTREVRRSLLAQSKEEGIGLTGGMTGSGVVPTGEEGGIKVDGGVCSKMGSYWLAAAYRASLTIQTF